MHPLMDPDREMRLWPHGNSEIYAAYNRVFDCRGHGWSNLQSIHINLPFHGDQEFGVLHAAIRLVLPLLPALAASSPLVQGRRAENLDQRLEFYRKNQQRIPEITGKVVPEAVYTQKDYEDKILKPCYEAISPHDPEGLLQEEWLNSRGAIARFDRDAIEIRVLDIQEAPRADFAIITLVVSLLKSLVAEHFCSMKDMKLVSEMELRDLFLSCMKEGSQTTIANVRYLSLFGYTGASVKAADLWRFLIEKIPEPLADFKAFNPALQVILSQGTLAERIVQSLPKDHNNSHIIDIYKKIELGFREDRLFVP
jgi:gamma-glutamyl:cysteine ligase YbdK (ATP-grasp superfamily)